jgi:hypothetical protein
MKDLLNRESDYALVGSFMSLPYGSVLEYMLYESAQKYLAPKVAGP